MFNITLSDAVGMLLASGALIWLAVWAQRFRHQPQDFIGKRKIFFAVSAVLLVVSAGAIAGRGFRWGMDFTGGTILEIGFVEGQDALQQDRIRESVLELSSTKGLKLLEPQVQLEEKSLKGMSDRPYRKVIIRMSKEGDKAISTEEVQLVADHLEQRFGRLYRQRLKTMDPAALSSPTPSPEPAPSATASPAAAASPAPVVSPSASPSVAPRGAEVEAQSDPKGATGPETTILSRESIDSVIGDELFTNALMALGVALLLQLLYITFRFGNQMRYGLAADIALLHDVVIMAGLYALAGRQVDSPFLAAVLTVIGYSVMDSIVVFDRIRENVKHARRGSYEEICNDSLNQTMSRSVNTTLTVLLTLVALYFFGGDTLRNFAFALLVGITSGAYSSVFVATPLVVVFDAWSKRREDARVAERRALREAGDAQEPRRPAAEPRRRPEPSPLTEDYPDLGELDVEETGPRTDRPRRRRSTRRPRSV